MFQVDSASLHCKYAARPSSVERIPFYVEKVSNILLFIEVIKDKNNDN